MNINQNTERNINDIGMTKLVLFWLIFGVSLIIEDLVDFL
jgi:hypothetical protein